MIRITAVILVVFSLGWAGCQSTHSDGPAPDTTPPATASAETPPQQPSAPLAAPVEPNPNTIPQTVQHTQRGMENMPAPPAARPATQPVKTLALTGPPRVPARATNQAVAASPMVVTQAAQVPDKGRMVIGPLSFQGPPRHKAYGMTAQQKFWTGVMGALVVAGIGMLVIMRKMPLWRDKLRAIIQPKGGRNQDGPKLVLQGAPQRASPLEQD